MPIYIKSRQVQGVNYVFHNGESYKRTGVTQPLSATTPLSATEYTKLYVKSCSAASLGEMGIPIGGTTDIDMASQSEVQLKFAGSTPGDTGELIFRNGSSTCSIELSVNGSKNLVWDTTGSGTPSAKEIPSASLPYTFAYQDCNMNRYDITLAGLGSYILQAKRTKLARGTTSSTYYAAASATGTANGAFLNKADAKADQAGPETLNLAGSDQSNVVEYTIYHAANSDVCFDLGYTSLVDDTPVLGAHQGCFTTDANADVVSMSLSLSGGAPINVTSLQCGDKVEFTDDLGNVVILEYRKTEISSRYSIDFTTHVSTFFVYRHKAGVLAHNIDCVPFNPGPVVPGPTPTPTPTAIPTGPTLIYDSTLSGAVSDYWALTGVADNGEDAPFTQIINVPYLCASHWHNPTGTINFDNVVITYSDYDSPITGEPVQVCFSIDSVINDEGEPGAPYYTCNNINNFSTNGQCLSA